MADASQHDHSGPINWIDTHLKPDSISPYNFHLVLGILLVFLSEFVLPYLVTTLAGYLGLIFKRRKNFKQSKDKVLELDRNTLEYMYIFNPKWSQLSFLIMSFIKVIPRVANVLLMYLSMQESFHIEHICLLIFFNILATYIHLTIDPEMALSRKSHCA